MHPVDQGRDPLADLLLGRCLKSPFLFEAVLCPARARKLAFPPDIGHSTAVGLIVSFMALLHLFCIPAPWCC